MKWFPPIFALQYWRAENFPAAARPGMQVLFEAAVVHDHEARWFVEEVSRIIDGSGRMVVSSVPHLSESRLQFCKRCRSAGDWFTAVCEALPKAMFDIPFGELGSVRDAISSVVNVSEGDATMIDDLTTVCSGAYERCQSRGVELLTRRATASWTNFNRLMYSLMNAGVPVDHPLVDKDGLEARGFGQQIAFRPDLGNMHWEVLTSLISTMEHARGNSTSPFLYVEVGVSSGDTMADLLENFPTLRALGIDPYFDDWVEGGFDQAQVGVVDQQSERSRPHTELAVAQDKLHRFRDRYSLLRQRSQEAARFICEQCFDLVFLDGEHRSIATDISIWSAKVKPGGILAGHDYSPREPDVQRAVHQLLPADQTLFLAPDMTWWWEIPT